MARLILVSHRLPITADPDCIGAFRRSSGGLVAALAPLHEADPESLWFGAFDGSPQLELSYPRLVPVTIPEEIGRGHYEGFSNSVLWPLFHYLPEGLGIDHSDWEAYRKVNELFAEAVLEHAQDGDTIWVHDYQLMLLPALLRARLPNAKIGFFLHIPFPSSEVFRVLPVARELLDGLYAANLIGLQTHGDALHLVTSFRRIASVDFDARWTSTDAHQLRIAAFPIGVDAAAMAEQAAAPETQQELLAWRARVEGRKVIVGIDRMDYTKGLLLRLEAYRRLLEMHPEWRDQAVFLQVAVPSRSGIPRYANLKEDVERAVGEINGRFGVGMTVPVRYIYGSVSAAELSALYQLADVALVTPLRDGMNLVAKEYVASRLQNTGSLVLSEFAGAAAQLGEALLVNPWDVDGTARVLQSALRMGPEEQQRRMSALRHRVLTEDVHRWAGRFMEALDATPTIPTVEAARGEERASLLAMREAFAQAQAPLIILDYDGTLSESVPPSQGAAPTPEILELLTILAALAGAEIAIVSGRDQNLLELWFGKWPVHLGAEHGAYFRRRGSSAWVTIAEVSDRQSVEHLRNLFEEYVSRTPGSRLEEKRTTLTWLYRDADPQLATRQARELVHHLRESPVNQRFDVLLGEDSITVRPRGVHKGQTYRALNLIRGPFDFVLVAGDDQTDEDLFSVVPANAWSIKVGEEGGRARLRVETPAQLRDVLRGLAALIPQRELSAVAPTAPAPSPAAPRATPG